MPFSVSVIRLLEEVDPSLRKVFMAFLEEVDRRVGESVTKKEFNELRAVVCELAEAQKKTEERVKELAEAQKRTEERLNELAEAQKRTEEELEKLVREHRKTREHLGGLTHTVGYILEDRAYRGLPQLLERDFGLHLLAPLRREYVELSPGRYEEVNILGRARKDGRELLVMGECKSQLKKADIDRFLRAVRRVEKVLPGERVLIVVTYQASPPVKDYAEKRGVRVYFSYEMPL